MSRNSQAKARENATTAAVMSGGGLGPTAIAKATGVKKRHARQLVANVKGDPELKAIHDEARARIRTRALGILESKLDAVDKAWTEDTPVKEQAQMVKALTDMGFPRWGEIGGPSGHVGPHVNINFGDPGVLVAMTEALRRLNAPELDVTPRKTDETT